VSVCRLMEVTYSRSLCDHDDTILFRVDWERPSINPEEVQLLCVEIMRSPPCPRIHSFIHQGSVKARHVASSSAASSGAVHRYLSSCEQSTNAPNLCTYTSIPWTVILVGSVTMRHLFCYFLVCATCLGTTAFFFLPILYTG
jgi:hypothetical protein